MAVIAGSAGVDRLVGGIEADEIDGLGGDDQLFGKGGGDTLRGGEGDDRLDGGTGADTLIGGLGNDAYYVDDAGDVVTEAAGEGLDTVTASASYTLTAGSEIERFVAAGLLAIDLTGNELANQIFGNDASNTLVGGGGGDNLYGRGGDDTLTGGVQDDLLDGGTGADAMAGGGGDDVYLVDNALDTVIEATGAGNDRVLSTASWTAGAAAEIEQISSRGAAAIDLGGSNTANVIVANNAINTLSGHGGDDRLNGRGGNDTLSGGDGDDELIGGTGADAMAGGAGDDTYYVDDAGDTVTEAAGEGADLVLTSVTWAMAAGQHIEQLVARGAANINLTGNELANEIRGNSGINVIDGGGGDDHLFGGMGDTLIGGAGSDQFWVTGGGAGEIRVIGDAADSLVTTDTGWVSTGTVMLDGVLLQRFVNGAGTLLVDAGVDTAGVQITPSFGSVVNNGAADRQVVDLTFLAAMRGFIIQGDEANDRAGRSVSLAGDVNGDGFDDVIIGADGGDDGGGNAGEAYVIFGGAGGFGSSVGGRQVIDLTTLTAAQGFIIQGDEGGEQAGRAVSGAGDVNGDGYDDLIVGAYRGNDGGGEAGEAYVIYGGAGGFGSDVGGRQVIDIASLSPAQGYLIQGDGAADFAGFSVSAAGDINGDGLADIIVGANYGGDGGDRPGAAYVVFGAPHSSFTDGAGREVLSLGTFFGNDGFVIQGDQNADRAGIRVSSAGDINGDGFDDIMVGATEGDDGGTNAGEVYVIFGGTGNFGTPVLASDIVDLTSLDATQGFIIQGEYPYDRLGMGAASAGDVNGDGIDDMVLGGWMSSGGGIRPGEAHVVFGRTGSFGTADGAGRQVLDLAGLAAADGFIIQGRVATENLGTSVSSAGDVNGDGFADLIVGARYGGGLSESYVIFGHEGGFGVDVGGRQVIDLVTLSAAEGFIIQGDETYDRAGDSVSAAGDVNGDGFADLVVGAYTGDDGGANAGEGYVIFGGPAGFDRVHLAGATDGDDTLVGTGAEERLIGGRGNDTLVGNGGADVFVGGAGDDIIDIGNGSFFRVDGGEGNDTLVTTGSFDFPTISDVMIRGIETIDITGGGVQSMNFNTTDVLAMGASNRNVLGTTHDNVLMIEGDLGDSVGLIGLAAAGQANSGGTAWNLYALNGLVVLAVDSDILVV